MFMRIFLLFFVALVAINGNTQVWTSNPNYTNQQEAIYRVDAIKLTACRLQEINHSWKDSAEVYKPVYDSILKSLVAIRNMQWSPLKDTVRNIFGFSDFSSSSDYEADSSHTKSVAVNATIYNSSAKQIKVYATPSINWVSDWISGNFNNTANASVNSLVNKYNLVITQSPYVIAGKYTFILKASQSLNTRGLAFAFDNLSATDDLTVDYGTYIGDGNSIKAIFESDGIKITYRNGCGDCPAGCTWGSTWTFKVYYESYNVQLLASTHDAQYYLPPYSTIVSCTRGAVLPMEFSVIKAYNKNGANKVEWSVETETNINRYEVEKSIDGVVFSLMDKAIAQNVNNSSYATTDINPSKGNNYYRIKAIDKSGTYKYSKVVIVKTEGSKNGIAIYPNPVSNKTMNIELNGIAAGNYEWSLFTIDGQKIITKSFSSVTNNMVMQIGLPETLKPGNYLITVVGKGANFKQIVAIQ